MHPAPGLNYLQSVTPQLSLGGEAFYLGLQRKSGIGLALRHVSERSIATCQLASTALVSLSYVHKVSDKVLLLLSQGISSWWRTILPITMAPIKLELKAQHGLACQRVSHRQETADYARANTAQGVSCTAMLCIQTHIRRACTCRESEVSRFVWRNLRSVNENSS